MSSVHGREHPVITGIGALTPLGLNTAATWQAMLDGRSGIRGTGNAERRGVARTAMVDGGRRDYKLRSHAAATFEFGAIL